MPALTSIIAGVGLAASAVGAYTQYSAAQQSAKAQKKAEAIRQQAMNMDAMRRQRQLVREGRMAQANSLVSGISQGAQFGSGLAGGQAQVAAQTGSGLYYNDQARRSGNAMFDANAALYDARSSESTGSGLSSLGGALVKNSEMLSRIGSYAFQ